MIRISVIILFLAIAVVLFFTQTRSYLDQISVLKEDEQSYTEALERSRELQALRDDLLSQYNSISQESLNNLNKLLPVQIDSGSLIVMLEDRMKTRGLLLKKIDATESKISASSDTAAGIIGGPPPPYKTVNLSLSVAGPYGSFLGFLTDLEKSMRVIDIDGVDFSAGASDFLEFNIKAKTYTVSPPLPFTITAGGGEKNRGAREILAMLTKLKNINKIDTGFFENEIFKSLTDFTPSLEIPKDYGRLNPFKVNE